jgi:DNA-binding NtrC family response regulator
MTRQDAKRILVVDDDRDICRNLQDILTDLGYRVDTAHDGLSGLELLRQRPYAVALLDLRMPGMDGLTLYRQIKQERAETVSVLVTAYATPDTAEEALAEGIWKVVAKPVEFRKLLELVGEALDQPLVLIVDDDQDLCRSLWDLFRDHGFRVCLAHDCRAAQERLEESTYRVVLIDLRIPGGDGRAVLEMVRQANPQARTILITGHRDEHDELIRRVVTEGTDAVCYKPFDVPELIKTVRRLARARQNGAEGSAE